MPPEPEREGEPDIYRMLLDRSIDTVTFTSASSRSELRGVIGEEQAPDLLQQTTVACIGPVTAEAAAQLGIMTTIMPREYTVGALVDAIVEHYRAAPARRRARRRARLGELELGTRSAFAPSRAGFEPARVDPAAINDRGGVEAHAEDRPRRQLHVLAFRGRDHAAAADQDAGQRALEAAEDAADDRADAGAGADPAGLTLTPSLSSACVTVPRIG